MVASMDEERDGEAERASVFRTLADEHLADAYRLAYAVLRDHDDASDAVHDAFVAAWEHWPSLRDRTRFPSWFKRILINTCRNRLSAASRHRTTDISDQAGLVSPDSTDRLEDREFLAEAIATLRPDDRVVLALRYYRDLKVDDIAEVLQVPPNTVTSRLHRAHGRLRAALDLVDPREERDG